MATHVHETRTYVDGGARERAWDGIPARIFLQPIAAPSVLGLYAFMGATLIVAAHMAGWYGSGLPIIDNSQLDVPQTAQVLDDVLARSIASPPSW